MTKSEYTEYIHHTHLKMEECQDTRLHNPYLPFNVLALSIHSCLNIGNMMRSANLTGVHRFFVFGHRNYDKRSAMMSFRYNKIIRVNRDFPDGIDETDDRVGASLKTHLEDPDYVFDPELFVHVMKRHRMIPIFIEQSTKSISLDTIHWNYQLNQIPNGYEPCLVLGNEAYGIPESILATRSLFPDSFSIEIPQTGIIASYNVSNCTAIVLNNLYIHYRKQSIDKWGLF